MDINEVKTLARSEMNLHGLTQWKLVMIRSKSFAGQCRTLHWDLIPERSWGTIELSIDYMEAFDHEHALDTIRHEIAHALDEPRTKTVETRWGKRERAIHHDSVWKAIAKRIGCKGERCVSPDAPQPKTRYKGICPNGHETSRSRMTWQGKQASCPQCDPKFNSAYRFNWYDNGVLIHTNHSTGAKTGRMSQTNPDLMTIPTKPPLVKTPYVPNASTVFTFDSDTDLTPEQIRILNGLLTKV